MKPIMKNKLFLILIVILMVACTAPNPASPTNPQIQAPAPTATLGQPSLAPTRILTVTLSPTPELPTVTPAAVTETPTAAFTATAVPSQAPVVAATSKFRGPVKITSIRMLDAANGWAIGLASSAAADQVLKTTDGGVSWQRVTPEQALLSAANPDRAGIAFFLDRQTAWVTYFDRQIGPRSQEDKIVYHTRDGGATWQPGEPLSFKDVEQEFYAPSQIAFADANHGWLLVHLGVGMMHDYFALFATGDGGGQWQRIVDPSVGNDSLPQSCYKAGFAFTDAQNGWMSGTCNGVAAGVYFYRTTDGGKNWVLVNLPAPGEKEDAFTNQEAACGALTPQFVSPKDGFVTVQCSFYSDQSQTALGWSYSTRDGGKSWSPQPLPSPYGSLKFISASEGWWLGRSKQELGTDNKIYVTQNGGKDWKALIKTIWTGEPEFIDGKIGWVVAKSGEETAFVKTNDGGISWQEMTPAVK
jgi:photosystem II stability/assembly factor-like uncharacterized protein